MRILRLAAVIAIAALFQTSYAQSKQATVDSVEVQRLRQSVEELNDKVEALKMVLRSKDDLEERIAHLESQVFQLRLANDMGKTVRVTPAIPPDVQKSPTLCSYGPSLQWKACPEWVKPTGGVK